MHLPGELNRLREVCRWFNHVITNSVPLMKRLQFQWNHESEKYFRSTEHKFCNVRSFYLQREDVPNLLRFVHQHHLTLRQIHYDHNESVFTAEEFHKILLLIAGTIEEFKWFSPLEGNALFPRRVLSKLKSLALNQEAENFLDYTGADSKVFMPKLRKFEYNEDRELGEPRDALLELLRSSEGLEVLTIQKSLARRMLTESRRDPFKFQLEQLSLKIYDIQFVSDINGGNLLEFSTPGLAGFLASQQKSLTHLTIENAVLTASDYNAMLKLELKHLEIGCCWYENEDVPKQTNRTIEKFVFRRFHDHNTDRNEDDIRGAIEHVLFNCKHLRSIELHPASLSVMCSLNMSNMDFLIDLTLENCKDLYSFEFSSLTTLKIVEPRFPSEKVVEEVKHLILLNPQLEKIIAPTIFRDRFGFDMVSDVIEYI